MLHHPTVRVHIFADEVLYIEEGVHELGACHWVHLVPLDLCVQGSVSRARVIILCLWQYTPQY
jgi:hypothetical protein